MARGFRIGGAAGVGGFIGYLMNYYDPDNNLVCSYKVKEDSTDENAVSPLIEYKHSEAVSHTESYTYECDGSIGYLETVSWYNEDDGLMWTRENYGCPKCKKWTGCINRNPYGQAGASPGYFSGRCGTPLTGTRTVLDYPAGTVHGEGQIKARGISELYVDTTLPISKYSWSKDGVVLSSSAILPISGDGTYTVKVTWATPKNQNATFTTVLTTKLTLEKKAF